MANLASPKYIEVIFPDKPGKSDKYIRSYTFTVLKSGNITGDLIVTNNGGAVLPTTKINSTSYKLSNLDLSPTTARYYFNINGNITEAVLGVNSYGFYVELSKDMFHISAKPDGTPYNFNNASSLLKVFFASTAAANRTQLTNTQFKVILETQNVTANYNSATGTIKVTDMSVTADTGYIDVVVTPTYTPSKSLARYSGQLATSATFPFSPYNTSFSLGSEFYTIQGISGDFGVVKSKYTIIAKLSLKNNVGVICSPQILATNYSGKVGNSTRFPLATSLYTPPGQLIGETYVDSSADDQKIVGLNSYAYNTCTISVNNKYKYYALEIFLNSIKLASKTIEVISPTDSEIITVSLSTDLLSSIVYKYTTVRVYQGQEELTWTSSTNPSAGQFIIDSITIPATRTYTSSTGNQGTKGVKVTFGFFNYLDADSGLHKNNYYYYYIYGFKKDGTMFRAVKQQSRTDLNITKTLFNNAGGNFIDIDIAGDSIIKQGSNLNVEVYSYGSVTTNDTLTMKVIPLGDTSNLIESRKTSIIENNSAYLNGTSIPTNTNSAVIVELTRPIVNLAEINGVIDYTGAATELILYYYRNTVTFLKYVANTTPLTDNTFTVTSVTTQNINFAFSNTSTYNTTGTITSYATPNWASFKKTLYSGMSASSAKIVFNISYRIAGVTTTTSIEQIFKRSQAPVFSSRLNIVKAKQDPNVLAVETLRMTPTVFELKDAATGLVKFNQDSYFLKSADLYPVQNNSVYFRNSTYTFMRIYNSWDYNNIAGFNGTLTIPLQAIALKLRGNYTSVIGTKFTTYSSNKALGNIIVTTNGVSTTTAVTYGWKTVLDLTNIIGGIAYINPVQIPVSASSIIDISSLIVFSNLFAVDEGPDLTPDTVWGSIIKDIPIRGFIG